MSGLQEAEDLRRSTEQVLSRPEFDYSPSALERFLEWLAGLFQPVGGTGMFGTFAGGVGWVVFVLVCAAALVGLGLLIRHLVLNRVPMARPERVEEPVEVHFDRTRPVEEWDAEAEAAERDGRWKDAVRARYAALVRRLTDDARLPDVVGRTTGELRVDLAATCPDAAAPFDRACRLFEDPWYGARPVGEAEVAELRALAAEVLATPVPAATGRRR